MLSLADARALVDQADPLVRLQLRVAQRADELVALGAASGERAMDRALWRRAELDFLRHLSPACFTAPRTTALAPV